MWNFKRYKKIVQAAEAYDVLKGKSIDWQGTFRDTFKEYNFNNEDKMPSIYDLREFIRFINNSGILKLYESSKENSAYDLRVFIEYLVKFVNTHLRHIGTPDDDTSVILTFMSKAAKICEKRLGALSISLGGHTSDPKMMQYEIKELFAIGYNTLNLLNASGIEIDPASLMYIIRGDDVKNNGQNENNYARQEIIGRALEQDPNYDRYSSVETLVEYIDNETPSKDVLKANQQKISFLSRSGLSFEKLVELYEAIINTNMFFNDELRNIFLLTGAKEDIQLYLYFRNKIGATSNESDFTDSVLLYAFQEYISSTDLKDDIVDRLLNDELFVEWCHKQGDKLADKWLYRGFSTVEVMEEYLTKHPERLTNFTQKAIDRLGQAKVQQATQQSSQAQKAILKSGLALLDKAISEGAIQKINPFDMVMNPDKDNSYREPVLGDNPTPEERKKYDLQMSAAQTFTNWQTSYLQRMEQERIYSTVPKEDLEKYASNMIVLEFDAGRLNDFLKRNKVKNLQIETIDFTSGLWRGVFVPRFPTQSGQPVPAIIIRTDSYDSLEHHKGLASSLGIDAYRFTESTRRHEIAHALHYLAVGDAMMLKPIVLNPELTEPEAYVMSPPELYARIHGDIPYLKSLFDSRIQGLTMSKKIYEAAKEQWIHDIVYEKVHLMSGGTNFQRLMMEDSTPEFRAENFGKIVKKDGTEIEIPDPYEAIGKILERQRIKLEMLFHDLFSITGKRDKRKSLISRKNSLKRELESIDPLDFRRKVDLEEQLRQVETDLIRVGQELIFDIEDVSTSVLKGYLKNYFTKVTDAVAQGLLDSDVIDTDDPNTPKTFAKHPIEPEPPSAEDISNISEWMIGQTEPVPGGRKIDTVFPVFTGKELPKDTWTFEKGTDPNPAESRKRPKGYFPGLEPLKPEPQSNITLESEEEENTDPFTPEKKAKVFNQRRLKG